MDGTNSVTRPSFEIKLTGARQLGRCYYATFYRITSDTPLTVKAVEKIRESGLLGFGQEFYCNYVQSDSTTIDHRKVDTKSIVPTLVEASPESPLRLHSYYVYECEDRVDSSG